MWHDGLIRLSSGFHKDPDDFEWRFRISARVETDRTAEAFLNGGAGLNRFTFDLFWNVEKNYLIYKEFNLFKV